MPLCLNQMSLTSGGRAGGGREELDYTVSWQDDDPSLSPCHKCVIVRLCRWQKLRNCTSSAGRVDKAMSSEIRERARTRLRTCALRSAVGSS